MPYKGPADNTLPPNIKALAITERKAWVTTFNRTFATCTKDGSGADCEAEAFASANETMAVKTEEKRMKELRNTLDQFERTVRRLLQAALGENGYVKEVFFEHPTLGTSAILDSNYGGFMHIPFEVGADEATVTLSAASQWRAVRLTYDFVQSIPDPDLPPEPTEATTSDDPNEMVVTESMVGGAFKIIEAADGETQTSPLILDIIPIQPGWGNQRDNFYYPLETLTQFAGVWEGAKMYATDHREDEKSVRTEVSQVIKSPVGFTDDGVPIARVGVFDPVFAQMVRNRDSLGILDGLHCSISCLATADGEHAEGTRKGRTIVGFDGEGANIDWVTQAGAGGQALRTISSQEKAMNEKPEAKEAVVATVEVREEDQETPEPQSPETPEVPAEVGSVAVSTEDVKRIVEASVLPTAAQAKLCGQAFESIETVTTAIAGEVAYLKEVTKSGSPLGGSSGSEKQAVTADEVAQRQVEVNAKWFNLPVRKQEVKS